MQRSYTEAVCASYLTNSPKVSCYHIACFNIIINVKALIAWERSLMMPQAETDQKQCFSPPRPAFKGDQQFQSEVVKREQRFLP